MLARVTLALVFVLYQQAATDVLKKVYQEIGDYLALIETPSPIVTVTCDTVKAATDAAKSGQTFVLPAGVTCGPLVLKAAQATLTTAGVSLPENQRVAPLDALTFAKIQQPAGASALVVGSGWTVKGIEAIGHPTSNNAMVQATDATFDQVYVHGDGVGGAKQGIVGMGGSLVVRNSYVSDLKRKGQDTQGIACSQCSGPVWIENNYVEASAENILFGGADPTIQGLVPSEIDIIGNLVRKPIEWKAEGWQIKNLIEFKNARHARVLNNVFENVWPANQGGYAVLITPRNQSGACPWCVVEDITFDGNVFRNIAGFAQVVGNDNLNPSERTKDIRFLNTRVENFDGTGNGYVFLVSGVDGLEIRNFTLTGTNVRTVLAFEPKVTDRLIVDGFDSPEGKYGVFASVGNGLIALNKWAPAYQWANVTLRRGSTWAGGSVKYPPFPQTNVIKN